MDLFDSHETLIKLPMEDGDLYFLENLSLLHAYNEVFTRLLNETPWRSENITIWGKTHLQPRLIAWYGDSEKSYKYSGVRFEPLPWTPLLLSIKEQIEKISNKKFNSVLLNYYRNGADSMGFHSDNEPELGESPSIASFSLGQTRVLTFKHKFKKELKAIKIDLKDGNLFLMGGNIQKNWEHGIQKDSKKIGARINLTFRYIF